MTTRSRALIAGVANCIFLLPSNLSYQVVRGYFWTRNASWNAGAVGPASTASQFVSGDLDPSEFNKGRTLLVRPAVSSARCLPSPRSTKMTICLGEAVLLTFKQGATSTTGIASK